MALKYSRQRQAVWDFMKNRTDHPSAETVYVQLRKSFPNISLGTVYRNLLVLKDVGQLATVEAGDGILHFDPRTARHDHLVCDACGCIFDIDRAQDDTLLEMVSQVFPGKVSGYSILYRGICPACLARTDKTETPPL